MFQTIKKRREKGNGRSILKRGEIVGRMRNYIIYLRYAEQLVFFSDRKMLFFYRKKKKKWRFRPMKNERYGRCKFIFSSPDSKLLFTQVPVVKFFFLLYVRVSFVRDWKMNSLLIYLPYHRNIFFLFVKLPAKTTLFRVLILKIKP